jgi:RHS repeat-associated protein
MWMLEQEAAYAYDPSLDTLTSETTGGVTANWTYDAAGNRGDTVADNLNRPTSIGGVSVTSDILGNRLTKGSSVSYGWDALNRMTSYVYRADGMRVSKSDSTGSAVYRYDGQMAVQDLEATSTGTTVSDYALGARGIDAVSKTDSSGTSVGYPLYDGHGNRVATLTKSGGSFSLGDLRSYDAWGNVLTGGGTGRPRGRYVANLGHVQDDESGLVYMRARYYEPGSGRFLSEDPARQGANWFVYCGNDPVNCFDASGKTLDTFYSGMWLAGLAFTLVTMVLTIAGDTPATISAAVVSASMAVICFGMALNGILGEDLYSKAYTTAEREIGSAILSASFSRLIVSVVGGLKAGQEVGGLAMTAVFSLSAYSLVLIGALVAIQTDETE